MYTCLVILAKDFEGNVALLWYADTETFDINVSGTIFKLK